LRVAPPLRADARERTAAHAALTGQLLLEVEMSRGHIYLIDDRCARRASLAEALAASGYQHEEFQDAPAFLAKVDYAGVPARACVLTHLDLAPMTGVELLDVFRADRVTLPVVLTGATSELRLAVKAMRYGGSYILWQPFAVSQLDDVLGSVLREWHEEPRQGVAPRRDSLQSIEDRFASLSRRQRQVLRHVFEGNANRTIADALGISVKTVELHRSCMMKKMRVDSATALIRMMSDYRQALEHCP
jgi:FixJ family two-component response regulator